MQINDKRVKLTDLPKLEGVDRTKLRSTIEVVFQDRLGIPVPKGLVDGGPSGARFQQRGPSSLIEIALSKETPVPARGKGWTVLSLALDLPKPSLLANPILREAVRQAAVASGNPKNFGAKDAEQLIASMSLDGPPSKSVRAVTAKQLGAAVKALHDAWPKPPANLPAGTKPPQPTVSELREFGERALSLDALKTQRIAELEHASASGTARSAAAMRLIEEAEQMHGKPGQSKNLVSAVETYLNDKAFASEVKDRFGLDREGYEAMAATIRSAAPYLDLGEAFTPVAVLAAHRGLSADERKRFIEPHPRASAELARRAELLDAAGLEVLAHHAVYRPYETLDKPLSPEVPTDTSRSPASQVIDVIDQITALSAKRFFRTDDGKLDRTKIRAELEKNTIKKLDGGKTELLRDPVLLQFFFEALDRQASAP